MDRNLETELDEFRQLGRKRAARALNRLGEAVGQILKAEFAEKRADTLAFDNSLRTPTADHDDSLRSVGRRYASVFDFGRWEEEPETDFEMHLGNDD